MPTPLQLPALADTPFYAAVLRGIGAPITGNTLAALYAWRQTEGGKAAYNPLNTTWKRPGSTAYNAVGVQNYLDPQDGVEATVQTLRAAKYAGIVSALQNDKSPADIAAAIIASPWGTSRLLTDVVAMFGRGKIVVAPITTVPGAPAMSTLEPGAPMVAEPRRKPAPPPFLSGWRVWALAAAAAIVFIGIPAVLLARPGVPALPAPPKSNPRRRRRR